MYMTSQRSSRIIWCRASITFVGKPWFTVVFPLMRFGSFFSCERFGAFAARIFLFSMRFEARVQIRFGSKSFATLWAFKQSFVFWLRDKKEPDEIWELTRVRYRVFSRVSCKWLFLNAFSTHRIVCLHLLLGGEHMTAVSTFGLCLANLCSPHSAGWIGWHWGGGRRRRPRCRPKRPNQFRERRQRVLQLARFGDRLAGMVPVRSWIRVPPAIFLSGRSSISFRRHLKLGFTSNVIFFNNNYHKLPFLGGFYNQHGARFIL